jgi:hypothetical protein
MKKIITISILVATLVGIVSSLVATYFNVPEWFQFLFGGGGATLGFALTAASYNDIPKEVIATIRQWHGTVEQKMSNISSVLEILKAHAVDWKVPEEYLDQLTDSYNRLVALVDKCSKLTGSTADRTLRNSLLKSTVGFCLGHIKSWAIAQYFAGNLTVDDVHLLGFFLPGETSGHRTRKDPTKAKAVVKVYVTHMDTILVVIDHSYTENAALVNHGWPEGVHNAVIVIRSADGKREIYNKLTTRLHTSISLPEELRGKQIIIRAAFLQHVDDTPKFSEIQPVLSMPLTTEDLAKSRDQKHEEEEESHDDAIKRLREELDRLLRERGEKPTEE